jgi:hypothetical protein
MIDFTQLLELLHYPSLLIGMVLFFSIYYYFDKRTRFNVNLKSCLCVLCYLIFGAILHRYIDLLSYIYSFSISVFILLITWSILIWRKK